jgi:hypothetical protein
MFSERYRPHDELVVYTRRKRTVNFFFRATMGLLTGFAVLLCIFSFVIPRRGSMSAMGVLIVGFGWIVVMIALLAVWGVSLFYVSRIKFRPVWLCACGYDLRATKIAGITRCPECGQNTT